MPRIERFFANQKVADWMSGALGGGAGGVTTFGNGGEMNVYKDPAGQMYFSHLITGTGNFTVEEGAFDIDVLLVAGGGSGGGHPNQPSPWNVAAGAGGGAGGARVLTTIPVSPTGGPAGNGVYPIVIGAGAAGYLPTGSTDSQPGNDSTAFGYTSSGGGTGANANTPYSGTPYWSIGGPGGSGGGGIKNQWGWAPAPVMQAAGTGNAGGFPVPEGNPGALGTGTYEPGASSVSQGGGGGGGAAGNVGSTGSGPPGSPTPTLAFGRGGQGGLGLSNDYRTGSAESYASGGGGGSHSNWGGTPPAGPRAPNRGGGGAYDGGGGTGAGPQYGYWPNDPTPNPSPGWPGGAGSFQGYTYGHDGDANSGGGGGGGHGSSTGGGGSGVVIIRYAV